MLSLFIFKSTERGTLYGVKTYLKHLTGSLLLREDVSIFIVSFHSKEHKEITVKKTDKRFIEIFIPTYKIINCKNKERNEQKYAARIVDLIENIITEQENVIFVVNYPNTLPLVKQHKSKFSHPVISIIHATAWHFGFHGNIQKFIEVWEKYKNTDDDLMKLIRMEKELYELSDKIISVTKYMKEFVIKYYRIPREKISVIYNGIDTTDFNVLRKQEKIKKKQSLGFECDEKIVLFSGRLDAGKGLYFLLDAFAEVVKRMNNVRLVLIGEDTGKEKICNYLSHCENIWSKVTFTGYLKYEKVLELYQVADIGIIPSVYEQCPYVALEMIGHNIPLIVSNIEGLKEILTEDQCLFLKPLIDSEGNITFDIKEIAESISVLLNDEGKAKRITESYHELIRNKFSAQRMTEELLSVFEDSVKNFSKQKSNP